MLGTGGVAGGVAPTTSDNNQSFAATFFGKVGIGTKTPTQDLYVNGTLNIVSGNQF